MNVNITISRGTSNQLVKARVVWDDENPDYDPYQCRTRVPGSTIKTANPPAVNRFYPPQPDGSPPLKEKSGDFRVNMESPFDWKPAIITLNGGDIKKWEYLVGRARATYNAPTGENGWPQQAYIVFSGNILSGQVIGDWFRFVTLKPEDVSTVGGMNIENTSHFVQRFTCIGWNSVTNTVKRTNSTGTPRGQVFFFTVTKEGYGYIPLRHVVLGET